jgi:hypothetical protein
VFSGRLTATAATWPAGNFFYSAVILRLFKKRRSSRVHTNCAGGLVDTMEQPQREQMQSLTSDVPQRWQKSGLWMSRITISARASHHL